MSDTRTFVHDVLQRRLRDLNERRTTTHRFSEYYRDESKKAAEAFTETLNYCEKLGFRVVWDDKHGRYNLENGPWLP